MMITTFPVRFLNSRFKRALVLEDPSMELDQRLEQMGIQVDRLPKEVSQDRDLILRNLEKGEHDLLFKRSLVKVDDALLQASKKLAGVMLCCIGDDSVDKEACARHGVMVFNDPVSNGRSVVEMVMGQCICMARRLIEANDQSRLSRWSKGREQRYEIFGKRLGILGLGNIGKGVAKMATALGMDVVFWDTDPVVQELGQALGYKISRDLEDLFCQSDVLTVHLSAQDYLGESNRGLITREHFCLLGCQRPENSPRLFINAARGFLYDPEDLIYSIEKEQVRGAAVDVFLQEPGSAREPWQNPYARCSKVFSTPHIGAATEEAQPRIAQKMAQTTKLFNTFGTIYDTVFQPKVVTGIEAVKCSHVLAVVHSDARGTKKAVSDAIFEAGLNNLESSHRDFPQYGIAYDISALDGPLSVQQLHQMIESARRISKRDDAIRSVRLININN